MLLGYYISKFTPMFIAAKMSHAYGQFLKEAFKHQGVKIAMNIDTLCIRYLLQTNWL